MYAVNEEIADSPRESRPGYRLCNSCIHEASCTYAQDPERQVMFCDEFEGETLPSIISVVRSDKSRTANMLEASGNAEGETELMGLCRTCERRKTCTYRKPEGGVWLCEEFE